MKKGILHTRIPTLFGFFILFASLWITLFSLRDRITITSKASPDTIPHNIELANISDSSFSVIFVTTLPTKGYISLIKSDGTTNLILDDRDKSSGNAGNYSSHLVTVNRLSADTEYAFKIVVNGKDYLNNGNFFTVRTKKIPALSPPSQSPIFGKILRPDGTNASDALVVLSANNVESLAVLTNDKGEYLIPTNSLRNQNGDYFTVNPKTELSIAAYWKNLVSELTTTYADTSSIPTITLSNEYEFVDKYQLTQNTPSGELTLERNTPLSSALEDFTISVPSQNEKFVDKKPQFKGTAPTATQLSLLIDTQTIPINPNSSGAWSYRPTNNLSQGQHTISLQGVNSTGKTVKVTRNFEIFPEGSQVVESATPSATPRVTPTQTLKPTITPTPTIKAATIPTNAPTAIPIPTTIPSPTPTKNPTPTLQPSHTPTGTIVPSSTSQKPPPEKMPAGSNYAFLGLIFSGFIIGAGTLLFLLL
jgi:hypothetical protein